MVLSMQNSTKFKTQNVIHFEDGIYGFETVKEFKLYQEEENAAIWSLQAAHSSYPSLIVINPLLVVPDYRPIISEYDFAKLENPLEEDLCILVVAALKKDIKESVVNLKSPILIHTQKRLGRQVIMDETDYPVRYPLFFKLHNHSQLQ